MSISNAVGGVVMQTVMLVVADATMRRRNLEYASRHHTPVLQAALLAAMLGFILIAGLGPSVSIWLVHPVSILIVGAYVAAQLLAQRSDEAPVCAAGLAVRSLSA